MILGQSWKECLELGHTEGTTSRELEGLSIYPTNQVQTPSSYVGRVTKPHYETLFCDLLRDASKNVTVDPGRKVAGMDDSHPDDTRHARMSDMARLRKLLRKRPRGDDVRPIHNRLLTALLFR